MKNSISEKRPHLVQEWSERNYPLTPDQVSYGSNKLCWWVGPCGHEWQTSAKARSSGEGCPICHNKRISVGINDLHTLRPELCKEWSEKNSPLKPTMVSVASNRKVIWRCSLGHEWSASIKSRTVNGNGCPYCGHRAVLPGFNDLATACPDIAAEWSDKNLPLLPSQVTPFSNRRAWWRCERGHEWYALISTRSGGSKCPYCSGIITLPGFNDLMTTHPEIASEWSEKNGDLKPQQVNARSQRNVWWKCGKCGAEWKGVIKSRVNGRCCPVCSEREILTGYSDLASTDPSLVIEWDTEKNKGVIPTKISRNSLRPVWWRCAYGHSWKDRIYSRAIDRASCPVCEAEFRRMLPQILLLRYAKQYGLLLRLNDKTAVGIEVDAFLPELNMVVVAVDRETKTARRAQEVIHHVCKGNRLRAVIVDIRKEPKTVCEDLKAAFRDVNVFIRGASEKEVAMARSIFAKCRNKKDESDNNTEP